MMKVILPISYLGSIDYYAILAQADEVLIECCESFPKQTLRNRCRILGANGILDLTIPMVHDENKLISTVSSDSSVNWKNKHWQALLSAYKSSPFFMYFEDDLRYFYENDSALLFNELLNQTKLICKLAGIKVKLRTTDEYEKDYPGYLDFRAYFKPSKHPRLFEQEAYHQVFGEKFGFNSNLSIIDLLCNEGRNTSDYLKSISGIANFKAS